MVADACFLEKKKTTSERLEAKPVDSYLIASCRDTRFLERSDREEEGTKRERQQALFCANSAMLNQEITRQEALPGHRTLKSCMEVLDHYYFIVLTCCLHALHLAKQSAS